MTAPHEHTWVRLEIKTGTSPAFVLEAECLICLLCGITSLDGKKAMNHTKSAPSAVEQE